MAEQLIDVPDCPIEWTDEVRRDVAIIMRRYGCDFGDAIGRAIGWLAYVAEEMPVGSPNRLLVEHRDDESRGIRNVVREINGTEEHEVGFTEILLFDDLKGRILN